MFAFPSAFGKRVILLDSNIAQMDGTRTVFETGAANLTIQWKRIE